MIDTLRLKRTFPKLLNDAQLKAIGARRIRRSTPFPIWQINRPLGFDHPRLSIMAPPNGAMQLHIETSIPKLLTGTNSVLPTKQDVDRAVRLLCRHTETLTQLPFDPSSAYVAAVHFAKDLRFTVPNDLSFLEAAKQVNFSRAQRHICDDTTVYFTFPGRGRIYRVYSKQSEVMARKTVGQGEVRATQGVIRIEVCLLKKRNIESVSKRFNLAGARPDQFLTTAVSDHLIQEVVGEIERRIQAPTDEEQIICQLLDLFRTPRALALYGFVIAHRYLGPQFLNGPSMSFSADSYRRYRKDCRKAGIFI